MATKITVNSLADSAVTSAKIANTISVGTLSVSGNTTIQAIFGAHNVNGAAFNALLESRGIAAPRAILTAPRQLTVVDGGLIVEPMLERVAEELMI